MPFVPFLSPSDDYLNYQRPRGFLDVSAAVSVTGLGADELLKRFLVKNLKVYLDCEPYRSQGVLRQLLSKKHKEDGLTEEVDSLQGTLFIIDVQKSCEIKPGVYPLTQAGLELLIGRHKVGFEGEELLADLCLLTPEADELAQEFRDSEGRIFVRLDNPLFTGHPAFHPCDVVRFEDLEEVMRNPATPSSSEIEAAWGSCTETEIFDPSAFSFDLISTRSSIDSDKEKRLRDLCGDWALQLREVNELRKMGGLKLDKLKTTWPMENLSAAFSAMVEQGWIEVASQDVFLAHFTNSTLKDTVPQQVSKLNWLNSKQLLHVVMKKLEITLTEVHLHFLLRGEEMTPIRSGLKDTERAQWEEKVEKLLKSFRS